MIEAKVIAHSVSPVGKEIITFQLVYPRFIHSEFMTHRVFSRNAMSSRAVPVAKMLEQVRTNPAMPIHWGKNQPGMQACEEVEDIAFAKGLWLTAANNAANVAELMMGMGLHKQVANRILEPFQLIHVIVTATEWDNWYELRDHEDADPNIRKLAKVMRKAHNESKPEKLKAGEWHLPYIRPLEFERLGEETLIKMSVARCARVSYNNHDGTAPSLAKDLELFNRLAGSHPFHASPLEHQAAPILNELDKKYQGNFVGWIQYRKIWESINGK